MPPTLPDIHIKKIELVNFRAFHGATNVIDLSQNKSLIVLGENGSGKTSLYYALKDFFTLDKSGMNITGGALPQLLRFDRRHRRPRSVLQWRHSRMVKRRRHLPRPRQRRN